MMLHSGVKIILWLTFAIFMQRWQMEQLAIASMVMAIGLFPAKWLMLSSLIRKTGILIISLFLVYGFTIPGEPLLPLLGEWSPSVTGMTDGLIQAWKLLLMLASLTWILGTTGREQFLYGIYWILWPAQYLGVNREQVAARIGLTLEYAVQGKANDASWFNRLKDGVAQDEINQTTQVALMLMTFRWQDGFLLVMGILLMAWVSR